MFTICVTRDENRVLAINVNGVSFTTKDKNIRITQGTLKIKYTEDTGKPVISLVHPTDRTVFMTCFSAGQLAPVSEMMLEPNMTHRVCAFLLLS